MSSVMIGHAVRRYLAVPLTPEEVRARLEKVAVLVGDLEEKDLAAKVEAKKVKEDLDVLRHEIATASKQARDRAEYRDVQCVWRAYYDVGEARLERTDTGHVVEKRGLTEEERQTRLPVFEAGDHDHDEDAPAPEPKRARRSRREVES